MSDPRTDPRDDDPLESRSGLLTDPDLTSPASTDPEPAAPDPAPSDPVAPAPAAPDQAGTDPTEPGADGKPRRRRTGLRVALAAALLAGVGAGAGAGVLHWRGDLVPLLRAAYYKIDPPPAARVTTTPADDADEVRLDATVRVEARSGVLTRVHAATVDGQTLPGALSRNGKVWQSDAPLAPGTSYEVRWVAENVAHTKTRGTTTFATLTPAETLEIEVLPGNGETYGIGQPIVVTFNHPVEDKAAVEAALDVHNSKGVEGAWRWFSDEEVRFRPVEYWPAHSTVWLDADLSGIEAADGVWGVASRTVSFAIGRRLVGTVDAATHQMTVEIDGEVVRTMPVSTGRPGFDTRNGVHRVLTREREHLMDSATIGMPGEYRVLTEYAVRLTYSGEFVHSAPWSVGSQGYENVSHGCINLSPENAAWFFDMVQLGDIVDVVNSGAEPSETEGMLEWNRSFADWKRGSALHGDPEAELQS